MPKNKNKPKNKPKPKKGVSRREFRTLLRGNTYSALQRSLSPRQFKRLRREARRRGFTLEGLVSGQPEHLKERSRRGVRRQAQRTVEGVYKPLEGALDIEEKKVGALREKRHLDNQYFLNWLASETAKIQQHSRTADTELQATQKDVQTTMDQAWQNAQKAAMDNARGQAGTVSDVEQSKALDLTPERSRSAQLVANERAKTAASIGTSEATLQKISGATKQWLMEQDKKVEQSSLAALDEIRGEREKLRLQRGADTVAEVARLLDREIDKANANREFTAALQQLGLDRAEFGQKRKEARLDFLLEKLKERGRTQRNREDILQDREEELGRDRRHRESIDADMRRLEREIGAGKYRDSSSGGKGKKSGLTPAKRREYKDKYRSLHGSAVGARVTPENWYRRYQRHLRRDGGDALLVQMAYMHAAYGRLTRSALNILRKNYGFWAHQPNNVYPWPK